MLWYSFPSNKQKTNQNAFHLYKTASHTAQGFPTKESSLLLELSSTQLDCALCCPEHSSKALNLLDWLFQKITWGRGESLFWLLQASKIRIHMENSCGCSIKAKPHATAALVYHTSRRDPLTRVSYCNRDLICTGKLKSILLSTKHSSVNSNLH